MTRTGGPAAARTARSRSWRTKPRPEDAPDDPDAECPAQHARRVVGGGACVAAGFRPKVALETGDLGLLRALVAAGLGVSLLPRSCAAAPADDRLVAIPMSGSALQRCTALAWRTAPPHDPAGRAFVALTRDLAPDHAR